MAKAARCPDCGRTDCIYIQATIDIHVLDQEEWETKCEEVSSFERGEGIRYRYDEDSPAWCDKCCKVDMKVRDFMTDGEES